MLSLLKIKNVALIDALEIEFGDGLNLLTGETGSGKSIIVDSLGALTGDRISSDLIKDGEDAARFEGLFTVRRTSILEGIFEEGGIELEEAAEVDLIVRRELSRSGKNRVFINNQMVTAAFLKRVGSMLVDIHGQGEQAVLFDPATHLETLDEFANLQDLRQSVAAAYTNWSATKKELAALKQDEAEKLQLLDMLTFQVKEIENANLKAGEEEALEEEKRRLNNIEKLSTLSEDAYGLLYENDESTIATLEKATRRIEELTDFESKFVDYAEGLQAARAVIEDLAIATRDFRGRLEFSPGRLEEIENRLVEISGMKRKYGGTVDAAISHSLESKARLEAIETAELRERELRDRLGQFRESYVKASNGLSDKRESAARRFEKEIEKNLKAVALEKARFQVNISSPSAKDLSGETVNSSFTAKGFDRIEFYFSANVGESPKPLAKVASGGETSRLMLILKTTAKIKDSERTAVFDEIDAGIGGRVAEAVGLKLKALAETHQVLCVTHQPQIASLADRHFVVEKEMAAKRTMIAVRELTGVERVEEIARMLAGERITDAARENAKEMLAATR